MRERKSNKLDEYTYDSSDDYVDVPIKRSVRARTKVNYTFEQYEAVIASAIGSKKSTSDDPTMLRGRCEVAMGSQCVLTNPSTKLL